jgi:death-on-curing protein
VHETLSLNDVVLIHERLATDFATVNDPISPSGVRSMDLLASAVGRQHTSNGTVFKYDTPYSSAAALAYGLCCNHAFHNGNKRTALVSMLVHLDRNRLVLRKTTQSDVYDLILKVAKRELVPAKKSGRVDADAEVDALERWLRKRATKEERWERQISGRELRIILKKFDLELGTPHSNMIDVLRYEEVRKWGGFGKVVKRPVRICCIGWHNEGSPIAPRDIKTLRRLAHLTEDDGIDARTFYGDETVVDSYINHYRRILRRLARQ